MLVSIRANKSIRDCNKALRSAGPKQRQKDYGEFYLEQRQSQGMIESQKAVAELEHSNGGSASKKGWARRAK